MKHKRRDGRTLTLAFRTSSLFPSSLEEILDYLRVFYIIVPTLD